MRGLFGGFVAASLWLTILQVACAPYSTVSPSTVKIALVFSFAGSDRAVSEESVRAARRLVGERAALENCRIELVIADSWEWDHGRRARSIAADSATMIVLGHGPESDLSIVGDVYKGTNLPWISFSAAEEMPPASDKVWFAALSSQTPHAVNSALIETVISISLDAIEDVCGAGKPTRDDVSRRLAELAGEMPTTFRAVPR